MIIKESDVTVTEWLSFLVRAAALDRLTTFWPWKKRYYSGVIEGLRTAIDVIERAKK